MKYINYTGEVLDNDPTVIVQKAACSTEPFRDLCNAFSSFRVPVRHRIIAAQAKTILAMWRKQNGRHLKTLYVKIKAVSNKQLLK